MDWISRHRDFRVCIHGRMIVFGIHCRWFCYVGGRGFRFVRNGISRLGIFWADSHDRTGSLGTRCWPRRFRRGACRAESDSRISMFEARFGWRQFRCHGRRGFCGVRSWISLATRSARSHRRMYSFGPWRQRASRSWCCQLIAAGTLFGISGRFGFYSCS